MASWKPRSKPESQFVDIGVVHSLRFLKWPFPGGTIDVKVLQVGPAVVVINIPSPFGNVIVLQTILPIGPLMCRLRNSAYAEPSVPRWLAKIMLNSYHIQFERDIVIWNTKKLLRKPLIIKEDGPILVYRRWIRQFFPERSDSTDW
jgi:cholesterol 7-dehydrogenase